MRGTTLCAAMSLVAAIACASTPPPESAAPRESSLLRTRSASAAPERTAERTSEVRCSALRVEPFTPADASLDGVPIPGIEDPRGALAPFYDRFARLLRGAAEDHVRIAVYGDSNMTRDYISGEMRRVLQKRHGDGGHGYVAIGKPWTWYDHLDVEHGIEPKAWRSLAVSTHAVLDDSYGFAGIAAQSISDGARAWVHTAGAGAPVGTRASRVDVFYLLQPRGGTFSVRADGKDLATLETAASELGLGYRRFELEDGPHRVLFSANLGARLLGVALERGTPGVVVDSLGVGGVKIEQLARMREEIAAPALERRGYDLVIVLTGATEDDTDRHDVALRKFLALHRRALPGAACLVMSPPDFANGSAKAPRPSKRIVRLGRRKRTVALETGCAFWDFHAAMGGELSIARFALRGLAWADLAHLTESGGALMARRFLGALSRDFRAWAAEHTDAGCDAARRRQLTR